MPIFATYLHPQTTLLSKSAEPIRSVGFSWPYFQTVQRDLATILHDYPSLPLREVADEEFLRVHSATYLEQLQLMAAATPPSPLPKLSQECIGMEYCLPGYRYSLGGMFAAIDA